jgi:hypothetical protein
VITDTVDLTGLDRAEDRLQASVATNDVDGLAQLLHEHLLATAPDGSLVGKQADVDGYASGSFRVSSYTELRRRSLLHNETGVTAVRAHIRGRMHDQDFDVVMDYTRTWVHDDGRWQVLAAHLSPVAQAG